MYLVWEIVGIGYLELNKKKKKLFMTYIMVMQLFFTVAGLAIMGFYIGDRINPEGNLPTILTGVGLILGILVAFMILLQFIKSEERHERRTHN